MNRIKIFVLVLIVLVVTTGVILAQGSSYTISRWSFIGGSSHSGGGYQLYSIAGQPEAGAASTGGNYTLTGGLRPGKVPPQAPPQEKVYIPIVVRSP